MSNEGNNMPNEGNNMSDNPNTIVSTILVKSTGWEDENPRTSIIVSRDYGEYIVLSPDTLDKIDAERAKPVTPPSNPNW